MNVKKIKEKERISYLIQSNRDQLKNTRWIFKQLQAQNCCGKMIHLIELKGDICVKGLEKALSELIESHDFFDFSSYEKIKKTHLYHFDFIDFSDIIDSYSQLQAIVEDEKKREFNLLKDQPIRYKLIKKENNRHLFLINIHPIVNDGWTINLFTKEIMYLYSRLMVDSNCLDHSIVATQFIND